ncbi:metal ABC transporter substrate-binding protein [Quadrisphaera setariae]|uniref:Zinc ABC transporter substrate-binding protein n=1 Tax=Quadrisphaera setariae TaxID=2593304 RepID=A0A5C8ZDX4_9ACTN|nr:metal ABC transporter substrate-binding protein [Quadrisphaera setariae]TXR55704.1 zinc ABC transporter substrate-binding protein [Quadrisphaera setariae]
MTLTPRVSSAAVATSAAAALLLLTACSGAPPQDDAPADERLDVVTAAYPLQYVTERIAGDDATATSALSAGTDVHEAELAPSQALRLSRADLVVALPGLQAGVDAALSDAAPERVVDVTEAAALDGDDLHFWLDPLRLADVGDEVAGALAAADPDRADGYRQRAAQLRTDLTALDQRYADGLAPCRGASLVTSHEAFGYLADRYGLQQLGVAGLDPEVEPTPARLRAVVEQVQDTGVRTLYFETEATDAVTRALASRLGTATGVLDPMESAREPGADLVATADANLRALTDGLVCS